MLTMQQGSNEVNQRTTFI